MTLAKIHFGINVFFEQLLCQFGYTLVLGIIFLLFIITIQYQRTPKKNVSKILNLADYPGLVKNDVLLLKELEKYNFNTIMQLHDDNNWM